jgi:uncharacterized LabA/DUF88 family protein
MARGLSQPEAPARPCVVAFIDGQNLFHCAKEAFEYTYPNFDAYKLAATVCATRNWDLRLVRFYSGVPSRDRDPYWHEFWSKKKTRMSRSGVHVTTRPLRYAAELLEDGRTVYVPREKGIDVRIAIDVITFANRRNYDVGLIFSQDQDLAEVAEEVREIARQQHRWIKLASAFPVGPGTRSRRGIDRTDWIPIDRATYDRCLDP